MWQKEGWPAQHGARERREVSLVEITTGVHRGAGGTWGAKKNLQIGHGCNYIDVHPKWHPRGRWLNFESLAAALIMPHILYDAARGSGSDCSDSWQLAVLLSALAFSSPTANGRILGLNTSCGPRRSAHQTNPAFVD